MKFTFAFLVLFSFAVWLWGQTPEEIAPLGDTSVPFEDTDSFALPEGMDIVPRSYRENWVRLTGYEFSGLHWNHFVVVYVNKGADIYQENYFEYVDSFLEDDWGAEEEEEAIFRSYEVGTVFLKEHFVLDDGKPGSRSFVTLMEKRAAGYDPEYGDWRYVWIDGNSGSVLQDGNSSNEVLWKNCIECHANMSERDFVFATASRVASP